MSNSLSSTDQTQASPSSRNEPYATKFAGRTHQLRTESSTGRSSLPPEHATSPQGSSQSKAIQISSPKPQLFTARIQIQSRASTNELPAQSKRRSSIEPPLGDRPNGTEISQCGGWSAHLQTRRPDPGPPCRRPAPRRAGARRAPTAARPPRARAPPRIAAEPPSPPRRLLRLRSSRSGGRYQP